jgi:hypothetical protein
LILVSYTTRRADATTPDIPTVTGNGLTYDLVDNVTMGSTFRKRGALFAAWSGASPSAGAITFDNTNGPHSCCHWSVTEFDGTDGVHGAAQALVQAVKSSDLTGVGPMVLTLAAASHSDNRPFVAMQRAAAAGTPDADTASWTELSDTSTVTSTRQHTAWRSDQFSTSVSTSWGEIDSEYSGIAVEIKALVADYVVATQTMTLGAPV